MKLEKGKWYYWIQDTYRSNGTLLYLKFSGNRKDGCPKYSEMIEIGRGHRYYNSYISNNHDLRLATYEELKTYLPKDYKFNEEIEYEIY